MNREVRLGSAAGLTLVARPSALLGSFALWALLYAVATRAFRLPAWQAAPGSLAAVALHWASVLAHHVGHAAAAASAGRPMTGVRLFGVLGSSLYPADEPALPAALHVRRALGGPVASLAVGGVLAALWRSLGLGSDRSPTLPAAEQQRRGSGPSEAIRLLATFVMLDNLVVLGLSSFLPLGFTDGSTLLRLWRERAR